ncbi:hypothetical protein ACNRBS_03270 [Ralstonia pseudosolanacearum]|uniref:hypothetical protein n=4 Tax=Ralstonia pseudosolanacearum TaxID=1310165 RepID=UPI000AA07932|nr:hypothetical protein [Ralstonia pseudosolanacearum]BCL93916.1 hypothetical protein MAFF211479_36170 [Ralstonia solanacearum]MDO3559102.1 hypothetical protein [Ralstonia pseudosolanacearum]MDO3622613.1 hypothetical protein [Ralstonia pseudosolanacearum]BCL99030.1 hypothetical protein MAFF211491_34820 [Ralstonia solanacearum]BCM14472.1 hypothetical protein MAFF241648_36620 [Ralstonia solanacearum]
MHVWGKPLEFWDTATVWLMWIAAVCGAVAAISGLLGAIVSREVTSVTQRESDERIAVANALAANSNEAAATAALKLEQLRAQVGPRQFNRAAFLEALRGETVGNVQVVYLRNDPECFDVAQQLWRLLEDAGWRVTPPTPIFDGRNAQPAAMNVDGQPAGLTVVALIQSQAEANAEQFRANRQVWVHTPFTTLTYAIEQGIGRVATHANGPNHPPQGTIRVVVAPR